MFGHLGYDLKNEIEELTSSHADNIAFPDLFFFIPNTVLLLRREELCIEAANKNAAAEVFAQVTSVAIKNEPVNSNILFQQRFTKQEYIDTIEKLRQHILRGDCYEINFCQEFFSTNVVINPENVYRLLGEISPSPFAAFYKINEKYLICASPERYLKKEGNTIISQPIKGTGKRDLKNGAADDQNKTQLFKSAKDRSENVMVVDLVRNDLSKICIEGSVEVEELFGIYSFPQVHQMISTVRGVLQENISFASIIQQTFPMGSMTGAPKKKVMELIEKYENVKRGIFSGAVGYINPDGDFDFNVVIRSLLYNNETKYLSYLVGSGITFYSDPVSEYEECLLKASAFKSMFSGQ
ncbi:MAG: anthranilate synthase component I family protein [Chitinophagaceae bacterium]